MGTKYILLLAIALFVLSSASAQSTNALRYKKIENTQDTILLDSLIIIPSSLIIKTNDGKKVDTSAYIVNNSESYIVFIKALPKTDFPLLVEYKVFPFDLKAEYFHKKWEIKPLSPTGEQEFKDYYLHQIKREERGLKGLSDFQKSGSISRAISVGSNQNLSVLSHMNLQISGMVSEDLEIVASVSDENIPIQPDGNTQQIQDFDKVFIQLKHQNAQITVGDFEMLRPKSYFLNYHKKAQGANASVNRQLKKDVNLSVYGGIALSRGKYGLNKITGIEGNQGPYKLIGANFERAIIVLSGTEKVYVDGKLLQRGQNYDYVIDYNTAEVTFMPTFPINKDKRISIEFQYSDRNYARYLANAGFEYSTRKWKLATHYYIESDLKNQPLDQNLSESQEQLLYGIGDSLFLAVSPSADSIGFNDNEVLYKKVDSLGFSPVYVYSTSPDSAIYRLAFSLVGATKGNYIQERSSANGRVFKWVSPINGIKQGDYEPVVLLVTPKKKQMISISGDYKILDNTSIHAEIALSDEDINTLSPYDKANNTAPAFKINIKNKLELSNKKNPWTILTNADYEYVDANFKPIERFRSVEFSRDWNSQSIINTTQQLAGLDINLKQKKTGSIKYRYQYFMAEDSYKGNRNSFFANLNKNQWLFKADVSLTKTEETQQLTQFLRHRIGLEKNFKLFKLGISEYAENNQFKNSFSDSLMLNSFKFQEFEAFIESPDTSKNNLRVHYKWREDYLPAQNTLIKAMNANEVGMKYSLYKTKANRLSLIVNYRQLSVIDSSLTSMKPEETSMGRIEHGLIVGKGSVRAQTFYQLGSGMETSKDFSYIEVAAGQGVYSWNDYNNNDVKELNEFEIAAFQDQANYIRIYVPGTNYIKTFNNQFSTSIMLNPSRIWRRSDKKTLKFIAHFSNQFVYRTSLKTLNSKWSNFSQPFNNNIDDPSLINLNSSFRNTFYFNRGHPKYGIDYTYLSNRNKVLMMNGYEGRIRVENKIKLRWNITRKFLIQLNANKGDKTSLSDYFKNKEYNISYIETGAKLTFQPNRVFRIALPFSFGEKENDIQYGGQLSQSVKIGINTKYNLLNKGSISLAFQAVQLSYNAEANDAVSFEMLEGLLPGQNFTWNISYQRNLLNNLQLSIIYNGRKSESTDIINVGSVQLRAFF